MLPACWRTGSAIVESAARRAQYVADIRQAPGYIRANQTRRGPGCALTPYCPDPVMKTLRVRLVSPLETMQYRRAGLSRGHRSDVYDVEFSPRGDLAGHAHGKDGKVQIWETKDWQRLPRFRHRRPRSTSSAFSPDGKTLATVDDEGKLKLWEIATGRLPARSISAHAGDAVIARFTPDGEASS